MMKGVKDALLTDSFDLCFQVGSQSTWSYQSIRCITVQITLDWIQQLLWSHWR